MLLSLTILKLANLPEDLIRIREFACRDLAVYQLVISHDLEHTASCGYQRQRGNVFLEFEQFFRQTDGLRFVISNRAIFDRYLKGHGVKMNHPASCVK